MSSARRRVSPFLAFIVYCPACGCKQRVPQAQLFHNALHGCAGCLEEFEIDRTHIRSLLRTTEDFWRSHKEHSG